MRRLRINLFCAGWLMMSALVVGLMLVSLPARAQDYPARDIHVICTFPAGTGADIYVRYFAEKMGALAGKPVIVGAGMQGDRASIVFSAIREIGELVKEQCG